MGSKNGNTWVILFRTILKTVLPIGHFTANKKYSPSRYLHGTRTKSTLLSLFNKETLYFPNENLTIFLRKLRQVNRKLGFLVFAGRRYGPFMQLD